MIKSFLPILVTVAIFSQACKHKTPEPVSPPPSQTTTTTGSVPTPTTTPPVNKTDSVCYDEQIQPIFSSNCTKSGCHDDSPSGRQAGVILDSYSHVLSTVSGNLLLQAVQDQGPLGMPQAPNQKLNEQQINILKTWIQQGMQTGIDCFGLCDTVNLSFSRTVFPIFQNNCIGCHVSQVPQFTDYNSIKAQVNNGKIPCVLYGVNCLIMPPPSAEISACNKKQIMKWIADGAPNN